MGEFLPKTFLLIWFGIGYLLVGCMSTPNSVPTLPPAASPTTNHAPSLDLVEIPPTLASIPALTFKEITVPLPAGVSGQPQQFIDQSVGGVFSAPTLTTTELQTFLRQELPPLGFTEITAEASETTLMMLFTHPQANLLVQFDTTTHQLALALRQPNSTMP